MNNRLQQFLKVENITQSQFADNIGVARASVSHILAGRNKPGFDFLENMSRHYPALNIGWLITGKGRMYSSQSAEKQVVPSAHPEASQDLFPAVLPQQIASDDAQVIETIPLDRRREYPNKKKNIEKIVVFYSDKSFEEFHPNSL